MISCVTNGLLKKAVPIDKALAPAIKNSNPSSALEMSPPAKMGSVLFWRTC
ncbi:hypothetical protein SAMN02745150_01412 [Brevinema andersonii]|uniref:Uncharacterized protein n=1 Tax=Brevinema andersonii TaxID=34097 RepID=A0A1I1F5R5_BREAD|nr:hypothetical protein SAMN02745150_01412 [Brevinema andersonii]